MKEEHQRKILDLWPVMEEDFKKFISDRPGWLIATLENAHHKKGNKGWQDIERVIHILQFLKDTEVEY
jgi:hypothetical protein